MQFMRKTHNKAANAGFEKAKDYLVPRHFDPQIRAESERALADPNGMGAAQNGKKTDRHGRRGSQIKGGVEAACDFRSSWITLGETINWCHSRLGLSADFAPCCVAIRKIGCL
ncbi:hypothetical protein [Rhizobium grahamii]|uniref:hypothetical protein n=1 Tax=Rhizobium grahamii TaxID=1120045 RepID=UPI00030CCC6F|nr:hypothetical protein [Rhizobium grahamii]